MAELKTREQSVPLYAVDMTGLTSHDFAMALNYSTYEAKARFSEVIRQVRAGRTVTVSYRGEPVAEIRSIGQRQTPTLDERLDDLERGGSLVRPPDLFQPA